jgi:hypothetical protein
VLEAHDRFLLGAMNGLAANADAAMVAPRAIECDEIVPWAARSFIASGK